MTIKRDLLIDVNIGVDVDAAAGGGVSDVIGAGVDVVGIGVDVVGVVVGEEAVVGDREGFSPLDGGDFGTSFTVGRSSHLMLGLLRYLVVLMIMKFAMTE